MPDDGSLTAEAVQEDASLRRDWQRFALGVFLFMFGFAMHNGVFQNWFKEAQGARELDLGILESSREVPGLLTALTAGLLAAMAEARVAAIGLAVTAIGIGVTGWMPGIPAVIAISVFWSVGFHLFATMQSPITLTLARGKEGGRHLGRMSSVSAIATICGLGSAWLMAQLLPKGQYLPYFVVSGVLILGGAVALGTLSHHSAGGERKPIVFRREYGLYYLLSFLEGCRRQIFSIFASFTLIVVFEVPVQNMLALQLLNAVLIALTAPKMGKIIDRYGERGPLMWYAIGLIAVFVGYATSQTVMVLYVLYIVDNVLFTFGNGFTTYLHRIVRPGELTPCVSMGITMNHIAAVTVPVGGAYLWKQSGNYQLPFWVGVVIAVVSLVATRFIPERPAVAAA
ncbi:MAG: MFS transporter [Fimbriimonadaceae bacterium]|nr:MFS transporter [Fimbriimonadaceae bacterium]